MGKLSLGAYSKFIAGILGQALTFASMYYGTNHYVVLGIAIASALGIFSVPNAPKPPAA
jgi:hypothetical protein